MVAARSPSAGSSRDLYAAAPEAACYLCGLPAARRAELLAYAGSTSLGCRAVEDAAENTAHLHIIENTACVLLRELERYASGHDPEISQALRLTWSTRDQGSPFEETPCPPSKPDLPGGTRRTMAA